MLRINLSTRPFYNERGVRAGLGALAALALGLTLFNAYEVMRLQGQSREARETIARNDARALEMRDQARVIRQSIDRRRLDVVQAAAREANALIERRTFSWTELLNQFQATLPAEVRIGSVVPQVAEDGGMLVNVTVFSRRIEDVEEFMDALEQTGVFSGVLPRSDLPEESGTLRTELQAFYKPPATAAASRPAPTSEPGSPPAGKAPAPVDRSAGRPQ